MEYKHAIVINKNAYKVEFVLAAVEIINGVAQAVPQYYELKKGESLVYDNVQKALAMQKPKWENDAWLETATDKELQEAREEQEIFMPEPVPNPQDLAITELSIILGGMMT